MSKVSVFAPATIGNVGPGFDVLGLALEGLGDTLTLELVNGPSAVKEVKGRDAEHVPTVASQNAAVIAAEAFLKSKNVNAGVHLWSDRRLPISGGLGSSAAASTSGAFAAALACGLPYTNDDILEAALAGEAHVAGRHLDNIAPCFFGGLTAVQSSSPPIVQKLSFAKHIRVVVVSPEFKLSTKEARAVLPSSLSTPQWTRQMALAIGLASGLSSGNEETIRLSLQDSFAEPARGPLIPGFAAVKNAALAAGALGCSISGAGPTVFALVSQESEPQKVADAMQKAFLPLKSSAFISLIASQGVRQL